MARDIELNGERYTVSKMDNVFEQTYLASRFAPLLAGLQGENAIGGIFDSIGKLDKQIMMEVYFSLLGCVKRQSGKTWAHVVQNDRIMFSDINMIDALQLAKEAFMENYQGFFQDAASLLSGNQPAE